jgi:hypothetical protein
MTLEDMEKRPSELCALAYADGQVAAVSTAAQDQGSESPHHDAVEMDGKGVHPGSAGCDRLRCSSRNFMIDRKRALQRSTR